MDECKANIIQSIVCNKGKIADYTHTYYKYPARFSPLFVRSCIDLFSKSNDIILDPFMGGATTLIEAVIAGRKAIGFDISELAAFIGCVKTTPLSDHDLLALLSWSKQTIDNINLSSNTKYDNESEMQYKHLSWRMKRIITQLVEESNNLKSSRQRKFAKMAILKTAQWALDCKRHDPSINQFKVKFIEDMNAMIYGMKQYTKQYKNNFRRIDRIKNVCKIYNLSAINIELKHLKAFGQKPSLVVTSPPYPGVHVIYHRWQINGRRETNAPFRIVNCLDGKPESYYTFGNRYERNLNTYFENALLSFRAIRSILDKDALVIQLVGFTDNKKYLNRYLEMMENAGFTELSLPSKKNERNFRIWRRVPNRKWYAEIKGEIASSKEVVLIHKVKN